MSDKQREEEWAERISAYLDGEYDEEETISAWLEKDPGAARQYRQYQKISQGLKDLPEPSASSDFMKKIHLEISHQKNTAQRRRRMGVWAAAALLLLSFSWYRYMIIVPSAETPLPDARYASGESEVSIPAPVNRETVETELTEYALWTALKDMPEGISVADTLAQFEDMPIEQLMHSIAEMSWNADDNETFGADRVETWHSWPFTGEDALSDAFIFVETLDTAEISAFNRMLRIVLAEA